MVREDIASSQILAGNNVLVNLDSQDEINDDFEKNKFSNIYKLGKIGNLDMNPGNLNGCRMSLLFFGVF